jgi:hypothetical protein
MAPKDYRKHEVSFCADVSKWADSWFQGHPEVPFDDSDHRELRQRQQQAFRSPFLPAQRKGPRQAPAMGGEGSKHERVSYLLAEGERNRGLGIKNASASNCANILDNQDRTKKNKAKRSSNCVD